MIVNCASRTCLRRTSGIRSSSGHSTLSQSLRGRRGLRSHQSESEHRTDGTRNTKMAWLETDPEREAWLAVMASLTASESADELLESLLLSDDVSTPRTPRVAVEPLASSTPPTEAAESDASGETEPKKKRKRRATHTTKQTLDELRQTARECEAFLRILKARQRTAVSPQRQQPPQTGDTHETALVSAQQLIAWKNIASRQYRWRRESEQMNEQLRTAVLEQAKIVSGLEKLLKRSQSVLNSATPIDRSLVDVEGARYARRVNDLMLATADMYDQVEDIMLTTALRGTPLDGSEIGWTTENARGALTSATHSRQVPCSSATVVDTLWKYYAQSRGTSEAYFRERIDASSDSIVKSFHVQWKNVSLSTNHRVIVVTRRFRLPNGVDAIVHIADFEVLEAQFSLPGFRTKGWSIIRDGSRLSECQPSADVLFKIVSHALPPPLPPVDTRADREGTTGNLDSLERRRELEKLVKFTLIRHNEGVQRAIDSVMLMALPCSVGTT